MGMSTHVVGFKPPDDKWKKMKSVWDACTAAKVDVPDEVIAFFGHDEPDANGVEVDRSKLVACGCMKEWSTEYQKGYELDVSKLPKDVAILRFYNSW